MKKNVKFILLIMMLVFLTGCSTKDDFIGKAISDSKFNKMGNNSEMEVLSQDNTVIGDELYQRILDAVNTTALKAFIEADEEGFAIDTPAYLSEYIKENGYESEPLPQEDYFRLVRLENDSVWEKYRLVVDNELIYFVNSDNIIVEDCCLILLSRLPEFETALISTGYENLYSIIKMYDDATVSYVESGTKKIPMYTFDAQCCGIIVNVKIASFWINNIKVPSESLYLTNLYQNDTWLIQSGGTNSVCESISFIYESDEYTIEDDDEWNYMYMRLDLYGSDKKLREVKLTYENDIDSIPLNCRFTITECLKELGCSDDEINSFYKELPKKSGNIGNLYFIVDKINSDNTAVKLYVK